MLKKLYKTINKKSFINKVITLDELDEAIKNLDLIEKEKYLNFSSIIKN